MRFALPASLFGLWLIPTTLCLKIRRQHYDEVPPMGFNTWNAYGCDLDLLNESNIRRMAHLLNVTGLVEAGYNIFVIDDCWTVKDRRHQLTGELIPDPFRFSSGMHALGNYLNSEGMKFGLYADAGTKTCEGYPGTLGYEKIDAETFARWNVEYLKVDGCNLPFNQMRSTYTTLSRALSRTGKKIHFSCSWPAYMLGGYNQTTGGNYFDWSYINSICDSWRAYNDIAPHWQNILDIMDFWGSMQNQFAPITALGGISDPDFLQVGAPTLTMPEAMSQMAVWSIVAAPLILSSDLLQGQDPHHRVLPQLRNATLSILKNPEILQLNQKVPRRHGLRVHHSKYHDIWIRYMNDDSVSMVIVNRRNASVDLNFDKRWVLKILCKAMLNSTCPWLLPAIQIEMRDLWNRRAIGYLRNSLNVLIPAHGCVVLNFKMTRPFSVYVFG